MAKITIRKLKPSDLDDAFALFSSLILTQFPEYSTNIRKAIITGDKFWNKKAYKSRLTSKRRLILGAFIDNKIVGLLDGEMPFGGVCLCGWLMVKPEHQKKGVGSKLLSTWEDMMKKSGAHTIYLYCDPRNVTFYEKLGFEYAGKFTKGWFGCNDYIMTKLIQEPKEENFLK